MKFCTLLGIIVSVLVFFSFLIIYSVFYFIPHRVSFGLRVTERVISVGQVREEKRQTGTSTDEGKVDSNPSQGQRDGLSVFLPTTKTR